MYEISDISHFRVICPIITPIGLAFVFIKFSVDKYLMIYFHRPCGSYGVACHMAATNYVVFSAALLQVRLDMQGSILGKCQTGTLGPGIVDGLPT